ncbi:MAG: CRTAC1 family protein [Planctomycetota bacterium]
MKHRRRTLLSMFACMGLAGTAAAQLEFTEIGASAGFGGTLTSGPGQHAGGVVWIDYNGDFLPDLFASNGAGLEHYLFRNEGDGSFTDVSYLIPKPDLGVEEVGALYSDVDNDGDLDLLIIADNQTVLGATPAEGGPNLFYRNNGGTFTELAATNGVLDPLGRRNIAGGFADYDRDGWVDLYLARWQPSNPDGLQSFDRILRNTGAGAFVDDREATRVDGYGRSALTCLWFDADGDLWPDLYVANAGRAVDGVEEPENNDILYANHNEGVRFCDCTGDPHYFGDDSKYPRGAIAGDIDNDGDLDLYVTDNDSEGRAPFGNALYLGRGDGLFDDNSCDLAGVCGTDSWGTGFADFDRDGWLDLWVGTASPFTPDLLFHNQGDGTFTTVQMIALFGNRNRGGAQADFDGDGDVDVALINQNQSLRLLRNDSLNSNEWLSLRLFGVQSSRDAIGARVEVTAGGITQTRVVSGGEGAHSQSELTLHFGLGAELAAEVDIFWPSGSTQNFPAVAAGQLLFVDEAVGFLPEGVPTATAVWSTSQQSLTVTVASTYGGRTALQATGLGALAYDASQLSWSQVFAGVASNPGTVQVTSTSGGAWSISTTVVP